MGVYLLRTDDGRLIRNLSPFCEYFRQFGSPIDREDKHVQWNILLEPFSQHEIDESLGSFLVVTPVQHSRKFNLTEASSRRADAGGM